MNWFRFFLGTPRRFLATMTAIGLITVMIFPSLLRTAVERLLAAINPLIGPAVTLLIIFLAYRIILAPLVRGGGRR